MNIHEYQAKELLKKFGAPVPNGVVVFNVIGTYDDWNSDVVGSIYQTLKAVFPHVYHFPASDTRNIVMVATKDTRALTPKSLAEKVKALRNARPNLPKNFGPRLKRIRSKAPACAVGAGVLTDNFAPPGGVLKSKR